MYLVRTTYNNYNEDKGEYEPYKSNGITFASKESALEYIGYLEQRDDVLEIEMHLFYWISSDNTEFNKEAKRIQKECKQIKSEWNNDYIVTYYEDEHEKIEYWDNMELGIPSEIIYRRK